MQKDVKFIIGGILVVLSILTGNWFLSTLLNPPPSSDFVGGGILLPIMFLIILIIGLKLIADTVITK